MAIARRARVRRGILRPVTECGDDPTPQTRAKLRRDAIRELHAAGRLEDRHLAAALEIRAVLEAVGRGMFPTSGFGLTPGIAMQRRPGRDFLDRMTEAERRIWQRRYLPWTKAMAVEIAAGLPPVRWLQLALDVVIDNAPLRAMERRYALRHGAAAEYLRQALELYGR